MLLNTLWRRCEFCAENCIPKSAGYSEPIFVIHIVVLQMIFLELLPVSWQGLMVKEIVCQIVANIAKQTAGKYSCCNRPVPVENEMCKLPDRVCQSQEQGWRHD